MSRPHVYIPSTRPATRTSPRGGRPLPRPPVDAWVPYVRDIDHDDSSRTSTPIPQRHDSTHFRNSYHGESASAHYAHAGGHAHNPSHGYQDVGADQLLTPAGYTPQLYDDMYSAYAYRPPPPRPPSPPVALPPRPPPPLPPKPIRRSASNVDMSRAAKGPLPDLPLPSPYETYYDTPGAGPSGVGANTSASAGLGTASYAAADYPTSPMSYEESQSMQGFASGVAHGHQRESSFEEYPSAGGLELFSPTLAGQSHYAPSESSWQFPEPQMHRTVSQSGVPRPAAQRSSRSDDMVLQPHANGVVPLARADSYASYVSVATNDTSISELAEQLSSATLESEEGLKKFQAGQLAPADEEWHRLLPETAREALDKNEVQRQSILFEVFKSERDYVLDLEAVKEIYIDPLKTADVISPDQRDDFIREVFFNMDEILSYHQRMLGNLFDVQREEHPVVSSVASVIFEVVLQFTPAYEAYIKHSPIAEARHSNELKRNRKYEAFVQGTMNDPRIKKRDLKTFLMRPVTRLPRLKLILENVLKHTPEGHPDLTDLPLVIGVLGNCVRATQPGIEAAESKVKFWSFCESLVCQKGEVIDMHLYDESRSLECDGTLARKQRGDLNFTEWVDYHVVLLDHYFIITREIRGAHGNIRRIVTSRPVPLAYLCLGDYDGPPEERKERGREGTGLLDGLRSTIRPMYPFTVFHAAAKATRRYTLYAPSEAIRKKWITAVTNTLGVYKVRMEANRWFAPTQLNDSAFRARTVNVPSTSQRTFTGSVTAAGTFSSAGKRFLLVGCAAGIYVGVRGEPTYRRVLTLQNPSTIAVLQDFNRALILHDGALLAYSLDLLGRVGLAQSNMQALEASLERVSGSDNNVQLFRCGVVDGRTIVVYVSKSSMFSRPTVNTLEATRNPSPKPSLQRRNTGGGSLTFRPFGNAFYVPTKAYDVTLLSKTVAVSTEGRVAVINPSDSSGQAMVVVPEFVDASRDERVAALKDKCDDAEPLGMVRVDGDELMVVYQEFGCYVSRHGIPRRNATHVRWESKAKGFASRGEHVLLFSDEFIEIRQARTGRLEQVIEGLAIRLLNSGPPASASLLVARRGAKNDDHGQSDEIFELEKTTEIPTPGVNDSPTTAADLFGEWDM